MIDNDDDDIVVDTAPSQPSTKEEQAKARKRANELKKTEERISLLEKRDAEIDILLSDPDIYTNSVKCQELSIEKSNILAELETLYERWEELAE
jgi:ATP-binding cassette subfamily F protein 3